MNGRTMTWRRGARIALGVTATLVAWAAASQWAAPWLIRAAASGSEVPLLSWLMGAGYPVQEYLDRWAVQSVMLTAAGLVVGAAILARRGLARTLGAAPGLNAAGLMLLAVACGIAGGLVEASVPVLRGGVPFSIALASGLLWMPAAGAALGFAFIGGIMASAAFLLWRGGISARAAAAAFIGLAVFGILRAAAPGIHAAAAALLSAGIGWQATRRATRWTPGFPLSLGVVAASLVAVVAVLWAAGVGLERHAERSAIDGRAEARAGAANVVLLILDTVRAKSLSLYGYTRSTSARLETLASRGVTFDLALTPSPWTLPAHGSFFTGRWPHELSTSLTTPLDGTYPTLAEVLAGHGYRTGGFVGNLWYAARPHGLGRGFQHYEDYRPTPGTILGFHWLSRGIAMKALALAGRPRDLGRPSTEDVNRRFLRWLDHDVDGPFFAFINYFDAHHPYETRDPFWRPFSRHRPRHWLYTGPGRTYSAEEIAELRDAYDATIAYVDHQLGALLDALEARGLDENTIVIVTADHGELLGEHGLMNHGNALYMPLLHVPLVIAVPGGAAAGTRTRAPATLRDLPATVLDLLGLPPAFPGESLRRHWLAADGTAGGPVLSEVEYDPSAVTDGPVTRGPMKSLLEGSRHYILNGDGVEELYDLSTDPDEMNDLSGGPAAAATLADFRQWLESARLENAGERVARREAGR